MTSSRGNRANESAGSFQQPKIVTAISHINFDFWFWAIWLIIKHSQDVVLIFNQVWCKRIRK